MASLISETTQKVSTPRPSALQQNNLNGASSFPSVFAELSKSTSEVNGYWLIEQEVPYMRRKVLRLSDSFSEIKDVNLHLVAETSKRDDETAAYVASRMPAVYSACYRVLSEVRRRLLGFLPTKVLDFGAGTGSAFSVQVEVLYKVVIIDLHIFIEIESNGSCEKLTHRELAY
ncbi:hypothetical protein REPUB_Repub08aG0161200 [Reevesia pubescens]